MLLIQSQNSIEVHTPAKINLFLRILGQRSDGFHELETVMAPVSLYDSLRICLVDTTSRETIRQPGSLGASRDRTLTRDDDAAGGGPAIDGIGIEISPAASKLKDLPLQDNLVWKALRLLFDECGVEVPVRVKLVKRIPAEAGLGGASSDAAAVMMAANQLCQLGCSTTELATLAGQLGSDVPFFIHEGWAACTGRGEQVEPIQVGGVLHLVIVKPPVGLATAEIYRRWKMQAANQSLGANPQDSAAMRRMLAALGQGDWRQVGRAMRNDLQQAADATTPWVQRVASRFQGWNCWGHQMSGSGSSYFGLCRNAHHARRVAGFLRASGLSRVFAVQTLAESRPGLAL